MKNLWAILVSFLLFGFFCSAQSGKFVEPNPADNGRPLLLTGATPTSIDDEGWEPPIFIGASSDREFYTTKGLLMASLRTFHAEGRYSALIYTYYKGTEFCKNVAASLLKDEFQKTCKLVGYRRTQISVDTKKRVFASSSMLLDRNGYLMLGIMRKGAIPDGWVAFDSVASKDRAILQIIGRLTSLVKHEEEKCKDTPGLFCPD
jgi:hypothetical protein